MIEIKNLSAGYSEQMVVHNINLNIQTGEVLVLVGPNGSGKSTLLKSMMGFLEHYDGQIFFDGEEIKTLSPKQIAKRAAFLSQGRNTPSISGLRMVLHGRFPYLTYPRRYGKEDYQIAREAMAMTNSSKYENTLVGELSGGERQSVYLAMTLAQQTKYIFMDEPTTYLDIHRQLQLLRMARKLAQEGKAVILVLHDLVGALEVADKVAVLEVGKLLCVDTPEKIYESNILDQVFGVHVHQMETPHGRKYYLVPKEVE